MDDAVGLPVIAATLIHLTEMVRQVAPGAVLGGRGCCLYSTLLLTTVDGCPTPGLLLQVRILPGARRDQRGRKLVQDSCN